MGNALNCCRRCLTDDEYDDGVVAQPRDRFQDQRYVRWTQPINSSPAAPRRVRVPPPGAPVDKKWYHHKISHVEAEYRLRSVSSENGVYLVYDNPKSRGSYILLAIYNGDFVRWEINRKHDGTYILGRDGPRVKSHESVRMLIKYHRGIFGKPIKLQQGGTLKLSDYIYKGEE